MTHIKIENKLPLEVELKNEIELCTMFLDLFIEPYHKWTISTSYHYKHLVERFFGLGTHISNEAFIISAYKFDSKPADKKGLNYYYKFRSKELSSSEVEKIRKINPDVKLNKKIKNGYYTCYSL